MSKVSAIIPSRLQENLNGEINGVATLWLDRAVNSVLRQEVDAEMEIVVGLSPGHPPIPERFQDGLVKFVVAERPGQAAAVNAAVAASTGGVLAFLEDDDYWRSARKLSLQLPYLDWNNLVTSNQREVDWQGNYIRVNNFATPSGWMMRRDLWHVVSGGFNEIFRFHVDTEWLGRACKLNNPTIQRLHLVNRAVDAADPWLHNVSRFSKVLYHDEPEPLVERMVNPDGGMSTIAKNPEAAEQSQKEHREMVARFGFVPW